jgi:hypothetical protein
VEGPLCRPDLKLIETMRWDGQCIVRIDRHLGRLSRSASEVGFPFDRARVAAALGRLEGPEVLRVRLTLGMEGDLETGQCSEAVLRLPDLRDARVRVGNSLRGLLLAEWAAGGS